MHPRRLRLRSRFCLAVLALVLASFALLAVMAFHRSRAALLEARQEQLWELAGAHANELGRRLEGVARLANDLATAVEQTQPTRDQDLRALIRAFLLDMPRAYGLAASFEPYSFAAGRRLFGLYLGRSPQGIQTIRMGDVDESVAGGVASLSPVGPKAFNHIRDYPLQDWYLLPLLLEKPVWIPPYHAAAGQMLMTTHAVPMVVDGKPVGVASADLSLQDLGRDVARLSVGKTGYAFLVTRQGTFLAAPVAEWVMRESIFSLAEEMKRPDLRLLGKRMIWGGRGVTAMDDWVSGSKSYLAYAPVVGPGWSLGVMVPEAEFLTPVWDLAHWQATMVAGGLLALGVLVWLLVMGLTRPLKTLAQGAKRLASGDLATKVDGIPPGDELGDLAQSFNTMVDDLNRYVHELTATTAAKERIESELNLAHQIQQSILPRTYPPFPDRPEFDLFARTIPARQVGGDFYDFFTLADGSLVLVVADVSGKGVGAALFMTVARTIIKNAAFHHRDPVETLNEVNAQIIPDNEMCMFVTVFYALYEPKSGRLTYASAGHPAPWLRRASDGHVERLDQASGTAIGVVDDLRLKPGATNLSPTDLLLVFTDGLDEAVNSDGEMFGGERAARWLAQASPANAPELIDDLVHTHQRFTGPVEQFDDLTLLVFRRKE